MKMTEEDRKVWDFFACNAMTEIIRQGTTLSAVPSFAANVADKLMEKREGIEIVPTPAEAEAKEWDDSKKKLNNEFYQLMKKIDKVTRKEEPPPESGFDRGWIDEVFGEGFEPVQPPGSVLCMDARGAYYVLEPSGKKVGVGSYGRPEVPGAEGEGRGVQEEGG